MSYTHFGFPKNDSEKKQLDASGPSLGHVHLPKLSPTPESSDVLSPKEFHQTRARSAQRSP